MPSTSITTCGGRRSAGGGPSAINCSSRLTPPSSIEDEVRLASLDLASGRCGAWAGALPPAGLSPASPCTRGLARQDVAITLWPRTTRRHQ
jgi:hypothetical protein